MEKHRVPGLAVTLVEGEEITYARGFGVTSVEAPSLPITPDTLFCCGSISKSLTAATLLRLVNHGLLDLDEPVLSYLPDLTFSRADYAEGVTLRRLLSHSSGLFGTAGNFGPRDLSTLGPYIRETVPKLKFVAPPGVVYEYSSLGIDLAGFVAEAVTGMYFPQVVEQQLVQPLRLRRTTYDRTVAMTYDVALPHRTGDDGTPTVQHRMFDYAAANPAGQAMTSTADLARFICMLMNEGRLDGEQVLPTALAQEMCTPQIGLRDATGSGYGLGMFAMVYRGRPWMAHGGMLTPYLCEISFLPQERIGVVWQCNATNGFDPSFIRSMILDEAIARRPSLPPSASRAVAVDQITLEAFVGEYFSMAAGFATLVLEGEHLVIERRGERATLHPIAADRYVDREGGIVVGLVAGSETSQTYFMLDEHAYSRFESNSLVTLPLTTLQQYVGCFLFDDGDMATTYIEGDRLFISVSWEKGHYPCDPLTATKFVSDLGLIQFERGEGDAVLVWMGGIVTVRLEE